jgi:vanillate O-demethylase monooxygenase subunit
MMKVFLEEDKPMFEACERMMDGAEFWSLQPVLLPSDAGAVRMRRMLQRLIAEEQSPAALA